MAAAAASHFAVNDMDAAGLAIEEKVEDAIGAAILPEFGGRFDAAEIGLAEKRHQLARTQPIELVKVGEPQRRRC